VLETPSLPPYARQCGYPLHSCLAGLDSGSFPVRARRPPPSLPCERPADSRNDRAVSSRSSMVSHDIGPRLAGKQILTPSPRDYRLFFPIRIATWLPPRVVRPHFPLKRRRQRPPFLTSPPKKRMPSLFRSLRAALSLNLQKNSLALVASSRKKHALRVGCLFPCTVNLTPLLGGSRLVPPPSCPASNLPSTWEGNPSAFLRDPFCVSPPSGY